MEDYINSIMFASDLVNYIMKHQAVDISKHLKMTFMDKERVRLPCVEGVGRSVLNLLMLRYELIYECYHDLSEMNMFQIEEIGQMVIESVPHFFPNGYTHCGFIAFCALAIGVSIYYLHYDEQLLVLYMTGIVGNVLISFMLTGEFLNMGGWGGLGEVSMDFIAGAKKLWNNYTDESFMIISKFALRKVIGREELYD